MLTVLDNQSWAKELQTGNAQFVRLADGTLYIVSNVRADGTFAVLRSNPVPPDPGPGFSFTEVATGALGLTTIDFDPVVAFDSTTSPPLQRLHIIGTQDDLASGNPTLTNLVKFTYDPASAVSPPVLTAPLILVTATNIQSAYDISVLNNGHKIIAAGISNPAGIITSLSPPTYQPLFQAPIATVAIHNNTLTITTGSTNMFNVGQLVSLSGLTTAAFLNGASVQATTVAPNQFTALYFRNDYNSAADTGTCVPAFSGQSLVAFELDNADACVANSLKVLANSPERSGVVVSAVSIVTPDGINSEVYYGSHPKLVTFADQFFNFYVTKREWNGSNYVWDASPTLLTSISGRFMDDRLTVTGDAAGNRYFSQIYYTQIDHPEGLLGNALLGINPAVVSSPPTSPPFSPPLSTSWLFHVTPGTVMGGSIVQGNLGFSASEGLKFTYLLQPFDALPPANNLPAAYPFHVGSVDTGNMSFADVPGFYNQQTFTWLRGTKSIIDDTSLWAAVGEQEVIVSATETLSPPLLIPATAPYSLLVAHASSFWQNVSVSDGSGNTVVIYAAVIPPAGKTQYVVMPNGEYTFNALDASIGIIGVDLTSNILTVTGSNIANFNIGLKVRFSGLTHSTYLNGQTLTITGLDIVRNTFSANFAHANDPQHSDTGLAGKPLSISYTYISNIVPVYLSDFNVPPIAAIVPTTATVYRAQPLTLSATSSSDADQDTLEYSWSENDPDIADVTLAPNGNTATLTVDRAVGGNARSFNVGVAVVDLLPDLTPRHPPIPVTNIGVDGSGVITVAAATALAPGEQVMLYDIATLSPPVLIPEVNDRAYTVATWSLSPPLFTATTIPALSPPLASVAVTGFVISQFQYAISNITVPFNTAPAIAFPPFNAGSPPTPAWSVPTGSPPSLPTVSAARNTIVTIMHDTVNNPLVEFPVTVTGANDIDDATTYQWIQVSGTNVLPGSVQQGDTQIIILTEDLTFATNGVSLSGETLVFQLTVNDGVNAPAVAMCAVSVAAYQFAGADTKRLSRSVWLEQDLITNIAMTSNVLTVTANNTFVVGQPVDLANLNTATFLNGLTVMVASLAGAGPTYTGFTAVTNLVVSNYSSAADTGSVTAIARISQRNAAQTWGTLDQSIFFSNFVSVKRVSVTDGTDRYVLISPNSVMVYGVFGGVPPTLALLRKLYTPSSTTIVDAVHTEDDTTLVLDDLGNLYRYSTAPLINTDNPDAVIALPTLSSMKFENVFSTRSFANIRILALSGPDGCLLLQLDNTTFTPQGTLALTTASDLVVGSDNVQFIRASNVESLATGRVLLGTVTNVEAVVTAVAVASDVLTVACLNNFRLGDLIQFSGFTTAGTTFLNGITVPLIFANGIQFTAPLSYVGTLGPTGTASGSLATATNAGETFETLVDLGHQQVIGTWNASNLRNQYVNTGEILFDPDSSYSGKPAPPVLDVPTAATTSGVTLLTLTWTQERPDLVTGYNIQYATQPTAAFILIDANSPPMSPPVALTFAVANYGQAVSVTDTTTNITLTRTLAMVPGANQYTVDSSGNYTFNATQLNHALTIVYRSPFTSLQTVNSGAVERITFPLAGGSYAFRMQTLSNDGVSNFSNVQAFSF
jgi:hypothetical protein